MAWKLAFGSYDFPTGFRPVSIDGSLDIAASELPRQSGAATQTGRQRARTINIMGGWGADNLADWNAQRDAILAAVSGIADLWIGRDDLYFKQCQLTTWSESTQADGILWGMLGTLQLSFQAARYPEPFGVSAVDITFASTIGGYVSYGTGTSVNHGTAETWPTWSFTIDSSGTGPIEIGNNSTSESCSIKKPSGNFTAGDEIVVSGLPGNRIFTVNGTTVPGLVSGRIPKILPNASNLIIFNEVGSATIAEFPSCSFIGRYK